MIHCAQFFWEHLLYIFQKFQNLEPGFHIFQIPGPKNRVWGPVVFLPVFYVQKFIDLFTILPIVYKFALILFISFSYEQSRQYGTSPFLKTLLKKSK